MNKYTVVREMTAGKGFADVTFIPYVEGFPALIIELKHNKCAESALKQIREKKYFDSDHVKTGSLLAKRWQLPILLANIISYHHNPSLSSIPVPCNLVCAVNKLVQDVFNPNLLDKDFLKTMGIALDDVEELRNVIWQKADLLISELT